jgi:hypothetical protein
MFLIKLLKIKIKVNLQDKFLLIYLIQSKRTKKIILSKVRDILSLKLTLYINNLNIQQTELLKYYKIIHYHREMCLVRQKLKAMLQLSRSILINSHQKLKKQFNQIS